MFCIRNISGPMFESTLDATHPSMNAQKQKLILMALRSQVQKSGSFYCLESINLCFPPVFPCFSHVFPCFVISSGEVNGFIFSHFIQLDLLQAGEKSLASVLRRIHHVEPLIWVCLKIVGAPKPNGFADHYPY